jgi:two-component system alkaline phosphatase synthesis response regulator PhoP
LPTTIREPVGGFFVSAWEVGKKRKKSAAGNSMKRILLLENNLHIVDLLRRNLSKEGFHVITCCGRAEGLSWLREKTIDLLIVERVMPGFSGLEICKQLRADVDLSFLPILVLSATDDEVDRVLCLELGADAYLTKPLELRELTARVKTLLWRADPDFVVEKLIDLGDVRIDPASHCVTRGKEAIPISTLEFQLLHFLVTRPNQVFTRSQLIGALWREESLADKSLDVYIHRLREKVEENPRNPMFIKTLRGTGYMVQL